MGRTEQTFMRGAMFVALVLVAAPALAHTDSGAINSGFLSGFTHPIFGWDHVIAMVAVGLWGAFLGAPAIWLLPVDFLNKSVRRV